MSNTITIIKQLADQLQSYDWRERQEAEKELVSIARPADLYPLIQCIGGAPNGALNFVVNLLAANCHSLTPSQLVRCYTLLFGANSPIALAPDVQKKAILAIVDSTRLDAVSRAGILAELVDTKLELIENSVVNKTLIVTSLAQTTNLYTLSTLTECLRDEKDEVTIAAVAGVVKFSNQVDLRRILQLTKNRSKMVQSVAIEAYFRHSTNIDMVSHYLENLPNYSVTQQYIMLQTVANRFPGLFCKSIAATYQRLDNLYLKIFCLNSMDRINTPAIASFYIRVATVDENPALRTIALAKLNSNLELSKSQSDKIAKKLLRSNAVDNVRIIAVIGASCSDQQLHAIFNYFLKEHGESGRFGEVIIDLAMNILPEARQVAGIAPALRSLSQDKASLGMYALVAMARHFPGEASFIINQFYDRSPQEKVQLIDAIQKNAYSLLLRLLNKNIVQSLLKQQQKSLRDFALQLFLALRSQTAFDLLWECIIEDPDLNIDAISDTLSEAIVLGKVAIGWFDLEDFERPGSELVVAIINAIFQKLPELNLQDQEWVRLFTTIGCLLDRPNFPKVHFLGSEVARFIRRSQNRWSGIFDTGWNWKGGDQKLGCLKAIQMIGDDLVEFSHLAATIEGFEMKPENAANVLSIALGMRRSTLISDAIDKLLDTTSDYPAMLAAITSWLPTQPGRFHEAG